MDWVEAFDQLLAYLKSSPAPLEPILLVVFVLTTLACLPASTQTVAMGVLFGFGPAVLLASLGTAIGAAVSRRVGRGPLGLWVRRRIARFPPLEALRAGLEEGGLRLAFLVRLTPAAPLGVSHWVFSVVDLPFRRYVALSTLATMPSQAMWIYLGASGRDALRLMQGELSLPRTVFWATTVALSIASVAILGRLVHRKLQETGLQG